ncbi:MULTISPECIES: type II toxin-antitoxin system RelE/ParE family toxin [Pseudomonas]|uniref:type II toxin-antitoxin system RelE/ParE family toxin n=1 Tax=Pseudomonas TaxID=286 RepID=UPI0009F3D5A9|nr:MULTISPECIES: type II toxin-antitoxin system RelE/ParE family toxin [unclassified Pseudomonas]MBW8125564.1 type II toxin-antitoxin system RelE/ParE family toxin [Pseudomonas sp. LAP_36]MBW8136821.1 type II toxin-antitoxin system RelE/ParE family toxin [Pseudomonas sp. PAMC 26818]
MELKWTSRALSDLARLFDFLAVVNRQAAARTVQSLSQAPTSLLTNLRLGERVEEFEPRDVRGLLVGRYEMRYEIQESTSYILRLWLVREAR